MVILIGSALNVRKQLGDALCLIDDDGIVESIQEPVEVVVGTEAGRAALRFRPCAAAARPGRSAAAVPLPCQCRHEAPGQGHGNQLVEPYADASRNVFPCRALLPPATGEPSGLPGGLADLLPGQRN